MGNEELSAHDQPTNDTWAEDWAAAEVKADARNEAIADKESSNGQEERVGSGTEEHGAEGSEASGGEDSTGTDEGTQSGEESSRGDLEDGGQGESSLEGGQQRDVEETKLEALPRAERMKQLREEAEDLGLEFNANGVTIADRAKFREEKRTARHKLTSEREQFETRMREATTKLEERNSKSSQLQKAIEANDLDGIAQAVGSESWNHLSETALKRQMNPEHRELMKLKREAREREAHAEQSQKTERARAVELQKTQARDTYRTTLPEKVKALKKYEKFHDDPAFITSVLAHQEKNWDGEETITVEEASALAMKDARVIYDTLHARFGGRTASQSENQSASGTAAEKSSRKTLPKTVSQNEVADASGSTDSTEHDEAAWLKKWSKPIANSIAQT